MDSVQQKEFRAALDTVGTTMEQFKSNFDQHMKEKDALLEATSLRLKEEIAKNHELCVNLIAEEVAKGKRPVGGDSPEFAKQAQEAERFAVHRKSVQDRDGNGVASLRMHHGSDFPEWEPNVDVLGRYKAAFKRYALVGNATDLSLLGMHQKDMAIGIDPDGGYFMVPPTIADFIVQRIFETSPMWQISDVANITSRSLIIAEDPSDINAGWVAERTTRGTTPTITPGMIEIPVHEEYAEPSLSQQLLEDSGTPMDTYIGNKLADKFLRVENAAFVSGNGAAKPFGFLSYPTVVTAAGQTFSGFGKLEAINSGAPGEFTYAGLTQLVTSLKEPYQGNAKFLIRRQSIYKILNLTDAQGRLIFQPLVNGNLNQTPLLGYELRYATDMPDTAAGAAAMAFGDFKQGYQIVNRLGISTLRDPYTVKGFVLFYTRKRVGGAVKDFDAIKIHLLQ